MSTKSIEIGDIINGSWEVIKKNIWIFAGVTLGFGLIVFIIMMVFGGLGALGFNTSGDIQEVIAAMFGLSMMVAIFLVIVLSAVFYAGYYKMALVAADGQEPALSAFSVSLKKILNIFFGTIIFVILVYIGLILCVVPGLIVMARLQLFYFFILDKDYGAIESLSKSWEVTKGETLNLLLIFLAYYVINSVASMCCIGVLVTMPMQVIGYALIYRKLTGEIPQDVDFDTLSEPDNI